MFQPNGGTWSEVEKLRASDAPAGTAVANIFFGAAVAVSGDAIIVGAPGKTVGDNDSQGGAYIFWSPDTDDDGLPDEWEKHGITVDAAGLISIGNTGNGVFVDLPAMGADPMHKDIFVHADWMGPDPARPASDFRPTPRAIQMVIDSFAVAPVDNPDGTRQMGMNLHVDLGPDSIMNPVSGATWGALSAAGEVPFQGSRRPR